MVLLIGIVGVCSLAFLLLLGKGIARSLMIVAGNFVLGFGSLYAVNYFSGISGFAIPVNVATVVSSGLLGLPGTMLCGAIQAFAAV